MTAIQPAKVHDAKVQDSAHRPESPPTRFSVPLGWCLLSACLLVFLGIRSSWTRNTSRIIQPVTPRFMVDINTASQQELEVLPEVGPQLAKRIVRYRETQGPFRTMESLLAVHGLGPRTLEQLRPLLSLDNTSVHDAPPDNAVIDGAPSSAATTAAFSVRR